MTARIHTSIAIFLASMFGSMSMTAHAAEPNRIPTEAKRILENASGMILMSLDPTLRSPNIMARATESLSYRHFRGWRLLGQTNINDPVTRRKVSVSVERSVRDFDGLIAACFNPRHALRVTSGTQTYDFIICYECHSMEIYSGDHELPGVALTGSSEPLDKVLQAAHVKQAKRE